MKKIRNNLEVAQTEDIGKFIDINKNKDVYVYDKEFDAYHFITDIYIDGEGDLILEIGGDA